MSPILNETWRVFPHTFAQKMSAGTWAPYEYLRLVSREITECIAKGNGRLIVELPARHGKSTLISYYIPLWFLSLFPQKNVILTTYEAEFAASWGRRVRNEAMANPLSSLRISEDSSAAHRWNTKEGGGMLTAGIGGPITGRGGNLIIIDDPVKNAEEASSETYRKRAIEWFNSTLYTRCEPGASIIILMTRWHQRDLSGYLQSEHTDPWKVIRLPALAEEGDLLGRLPQAPLCPERYDYESLCKIKDAVGSKVWSALYQQRPTSDEGGIIKRHWIKFWDALPDQFDEILQSWDLAFKDSVKSDYVVGQVWGRIGSQFFLIDQVRERADFPKTLQLIRRTTERYPRAALKLVEEKANGAAVISTLKNEIAGLVAINPSSSKESRLNSVSHLFEAGNVLLPNPRSCIWSQDLIEELANFPNAKNDDQVDAASQALTRLKENNFNWFMAMCKL